MKKILYLSTFFFPVLAQGMENTDTQPTSIIPTLYQMNSAQLSDLSTVIRDNFKALTTEEVIHLPFSAEQGYIVHHHFATNLPEISGVTWKIASSQFADTAPIDLCSFMKLYADINSIHEQQVHSKTITSFSVSAAPSLTSSTLNLSAITPYVFAASKFGPFKISSVDLTQIYKNEHCFGKIRDHFKAIQQTFTCLPTVTTWNWLELRYHLNRMGQYFGGEFNVVAPPPYHEHAPYANLFTGQVAEIKTFLDHIKALSTQLKQIISLPLPNQDKAELEVSVAAKGAKSAIYVEVKTADYHDMLKVFFDQLPQLGIDESLKNSPQLASIYSFWHLYQDLNKNYRKSSSSLKSTTYTYDLNAAKLTSLCKKLFNKDYKENVVATVIETQNGCEIVNRLLKSFHNPFAPRLDEVLAFTYYQHQLSQLLETETTRIQKADLESKAPKKSLRNYLPGFSYFSTDDLQ